MLGAALRDGDEAALATLYDRYMPGIYDFVARYLRDPFAAEDLTQMTFVRAWSSRTSLRDPERVRAWLYTIAHNLATNHATRTRKSETIEDRFDLASTDPGPEALATTQDTANLVWAAAASLEPRQYAVLDLFLRRELSTSEIAQVLGIPAGHAAVLVNRAKEALGNAVRYLLVARRRDHCARLAELVPAGVQALTPEQRSSVDRHMRRCSECQGLASRLTSPAELFGGLVALPVPASLHRDRRDFVLTSSRHRPGRLGRRGSGTARRGAGGHPPTSPWKRISKRTTAAAGLVLLLLAAAAVEVYIHGPGAGLTYPRGTAAYGSAGSAPPGGGSTSPRASSSDGTPPPPGQGAGAPPQQPPGRPVVGIPPPPNPSRAVPPVTSPTPAATATPAPPATASPAATASPVPAPTAPPTATPTATPAPTSTPTPTPSGSPSPSPTASPTPTPTSTPTPPFTVGHVSLAASNPGGPGGCSQVGRGYRCFFTVTVEVNNPRPGLAVSGTLDTRAHGLDGQSQSRTAGFSGRVLSGSRPIEIPVAVDFNFSPCSNTVGQSTPSTATASTLQPNGVSSTAIDFGAICSPPPPPPFKVTRVSLSPANPQDAAACPTDASGRYLCYFGVSIDVVNAGDSASVDGKLDLTAHGVNGETQQVSAPFSTVVQPGSGKAYVIVTALFSFSPCSSIAGQNTTSTATATTLHPNQLTSVPLNFGDSCTPPPPFAVTQVTVDWTDAGSGVGCIATNPGYECSFTVNLGVINPRPDSSVSGSLTADAHGVNGESQRRVLNFSGSVTSGATTVSLPVKADFDFPPCINPIGQTAASTSLAAAQQPNVVASQPVAFGTTCTPPPPPYTVTSVSLTALPPPGGATGCMADSTGYLCNFGVNVDVRDAGDNASVTGHLNLTAYGADGTKEQQAASFSSSVPPGSGTVYVPVSAHFSLAPCSNALNQAPGSSGTASTEQPNAVNSDPVGFGTTCTPPPPFTVTGVTVNPLNQGACPENSLGQFVCSFTIQVDYRSAPAVAVVSGSLDANAYTFGNQHQEQVTGISYSVSQGDGTAFIPASASFSFSPCSTQYSNAPHSTATVTIQTPNGIASAPVDFGSICIG